MNKTKKAQVIICKCGAIFAACLEPNCYTDKEWQKDLRKYVNNGCTAQTKNTNDFKFEECICDKVNDININGLLLF